MSICFSLRTRRRRRFAFCRKGSRRTIWNRKRCETKTRSRTVRRRVRRKFWDRILRGRTRRLLCLVWQERKGRVFDSAERWPQILSPLACPRDADKQGGATQAFRAVQKKASLSFRLRLHSGPAVLASRDR